MTRLLLPVKAVRSRPRVDDFHTLPAGVTAAGGVPTRTATLTKGVLLCQALNATASVSGANLIKPKQSQA